MGFVDKTLNAAVTGKTVTGLGVTQTGVMTLEVASGSVLIHQTGVTFTLAVATDHVFTADSTNPKQVFMALIDNGAATDLWVDSYVDDGLTERADIPSGYSLIIDLVWFTIAANETDIVINGTVNRRVYV